MLNSESLRQYEFPITAQKTFLAHAASSPFPQRVLEAIQVYVESAASKGQWEFIYGGIDKQTREYAAALLGAESGEIAFVSSTSMGLSLVAGGLTWRRGENVVIADGDFPSNIYPWLNLRSKGVQVKFIPRKIDGSVTLDDIKRTVDENTRLVSLSTVNFVTGYRIDVDSIGQYLHQKGILFCLDAVQSLGAIPLSVKYVDFLASSAHKWLLAPLGIGLFYSKREHFEKLHPVLAGWKSVEFNKRYLVYDLCFLDSAQRYEPGGLSILGLMGLHAALKLLLDVGIENIAGRLSRLQGMLIPAISEKGYEVISPSSAGQSSGITSFVSHKLDINNVRNELDNQGYVVSLRDSLDGGKCIRVSPHFYNTEQEIQGFLDKLPVSDK